MSSKDGCGDAGTEEVLGMKGITCVCSSDLCNSAGTDSVSATVFATSAAIAAAAVTLLG